MGHEAIVELDRDYVLAELRAASIRAQLYKNEIDVIGIALKANMMRPVEAIEALAEVNGLAFLHPEPLESEIEAQVAARVKFETTPGL